MPPDARILLFVALTFVVFAVGRRFQQMVYLWRKWRDTVTALPGMRKDAWGGVRVLVKVAAGAAVVFWLVTNIDRFM